MKITVGKKTIDVKKNSVLANKIKSALKSVTASSLLSPKEYRQASDTIGNRDPNALGDDDALLNSMNDLAGHHEAMARFHENLANAHPKHFMSKHHKALAAAHKAAQEGLEDYY